MAMEALPVFLDSLLAEWCSILISVSLILAFGEIIPQAVFPVWTKCGCKALSVCQVSCYNCLPYSLPNQQVVGYNPWEGAFYALRRAELQTLVDMHGNEAGKGGELTNHETTIINGALDLTQKTAKDAMTPISEIFSLDLNSKLDEDTMSLIMHKGHSRVPVYSGGSANLIGVILVKNLIKCHPEDETPIRNLTIRRIPRIHYCLPLYELLNLFQKGHSHMAVVVKSKSDLNDNAENVIAQRNIVKIKINLSSTRGQVEQREVDYQNSSSVTSSDTESRSSELDRKITNDGVEYFINSDKEEIVGLITMADVLEELLQEPIIDETDEYVDFHNRIQINMLPSIKPPLGSPGRASASTYFSCRTLAASPIPSSASCTPLSSYHHTQVMRSPLSPFIQSPIMKPTLSASPRKSTPSSPAAHSSSSPSSHRVSRKTYEKLRKPGDRMVNSTRISWKREVALLCLVFELCEF